MFLRFRRRVATVARSFAAQTNRLRHGSSTVRSTKWTPKFNQWRTDRLFLAGALMTSVAFTSCGEGECSRKRRNVRKEKLHGKRIARIKSLRKLFEHLDENKEDAICLAELEKFLTAHDEYLDLMRDGESVSVHSMAKTILRRADVDNGEGGEHDHGDQLLSFKEFSAFMMTLLGGIFLKVDVDKSGKVDGDEIRMLLNLMYGDNYMESVLSNPKLGIHKATRDVFLELTSTCAEQQIATNFDQMACVDFILHLVVDGENIDAPALARLLCAATMSEEEWQSTCTKCSGNVFAVVESISDGLETTAI